MCLEVGGCHRQPRGCNPFAETGRCAFTSYLSRRGNSMDSNEIDVVFQVNKHFGPNVAPNWMAMQLFHTQSIQENGLFFLCMNTDKVSFGFWKPLSINLLVSGLRRRFF